MTDDGALGKQIRELRTARGLSIKELAEISELSAGAISHIERGLSSTSIRSIRNICHALQVPLGVLFRSHLSELESAYVRKRNQRSFLDVGHGTVKEMLSTGSLKELELLLVNIEPGGHSGHQTCSHDGEEMGLVAGQSIFTPHFGTQNIKEHRGAVLQEFIYDIYHICPCNKSDLKLECARAGESCF